MSRKSFIISAIVLLTTITLVVLIARRGQPLVVKTNLENIPMEIAGYKATEDSFPDSVYDLLNADKHVYRHYKGVNGSKIDLYIGYYGTKKGGRTVHTPYRCLPAGGWAILKRQKVRFAPRYYPEGVNLNYILARKGDVFVCMYHWYQSAGKKVLSTRFKQVFEHLEGTVLRNRSDGAFVEVSILTTDNGIEEAKLLAKNFLEELLDLIPNYWPVEE